eukprot:SAG22_NODE_801_length_7103_cov_18.044832_3_plen_177_part_00
MAYFETAADPSAALRAADEIDTSLIQIPQSLLQTTVDLASRITVVSCLCLQAVGHPVAIDIRAVWLQLPNTCWFVSKAYRTSPDILRAMCFVIPTINILKHLIVRLYRKTMNRISKGRMPAQEGSIPASSSEMADCRSFAREEETLAEFKAANEIQCELNAQQQNFTQLIVPAFDL